MHSTTFSIVVQAVRYLDPAGCVQMMSLCPHFTFGELLADAVEEYVRRMERANGVFPIYRKFNTKI